MTKNELEEKIKNGENVWCVRVCGVVRDVQFDKKDLKRINNDSKGLNEIFKTKAEEKLQELRGDKKWIYRILLIVI